MYRIPFDEFKTNLELDLSRFVKSFQFKSKKTGKSKGGTYIPYNRMVTILREYYPEATPMLDSFQTLADNGSVVLAVFLDWGEKGRSPLMHYPVMNHGIGQHGAVSLPDSREFTDSLYRAYAKLISMETGLGWSCWLEEPDPQDPEDEEEPTPRSRRSKPAFDFDEDEPKKKKSKPWDDEDDDTEEIEDEEEDEVEEEEEQPKRRAASRFRSRRSR